MLYVTRTLCVSGFAKQVINSSRKLITGGLSKESTNSYKMALILILIIIISHNFNWGTLSFPVIATCPKALNERKIHFRNLSWRDLREREITQIKRDQNSLALKKQSRLQGVVLFRPDKSIIIFYFKKERSVQINQL